MDRVAHTQVFPGGIRQVGHVVEDLDAAIADWLAIGVGPWTVIEVDHDDNLYRGESSSAHMVVGMANDGPLQIELIQVTGPGRSIWHEARDAGRFGQHHLAYWTEEFETVLAAAEASGLSLVHRGNGGGVVPFAYFETPLGVLLELMELNEITTMVNDQVRADSETWDGSEPSVRR